MGTQLKDALEAELAKLSPEERALMETIHRLRNELQEAQMRLRLLRSAAPQGEDDAS